MGRVVARRAGAHDQGHVEVVVDPRNPADRDWQRIEEILPARDRGPCGGSAAASASRPSFVLSEHEGTELRLLGIAVGPRWVAAKRVIHAEDEPLPREPLR